MICFGSFLSIQPLMMRSQLLFHIKYQKYFYVVAHKTSFYFVLHFFSRFLCCLVLLWFFHWSKWHFTNMVSPPPPQPLPHFKWHLKSLDFLNLVGFWVMLCIDCCWRQNKAYFGMCLCKFRFALTSWCKLLNLFIEYFSFFFLF